MKTLYPRDQRLNIGNFDFLHTLIGFGWLSLTQVSAKLSDVIAPECAIRQYLHHSKQKRKRLLPEMEIAKGRRTVVCKLSYRLIRSGYIERKVNGEPYYKITKKGIEAHAKHKARKDNASRRHAAAS